MYDRTRTWIIGSVCLMAAATLACAGGDGPSSPTAPSVPAALAASPSNMGLDHATNFTFTASGIGTSRAFAWDFGDGTTATSTAPTTTHVYNRSGIFTAHVDATDDRGMVRKADLGVTVKPVTGTWDLTLVPSSQWLYCTRLTAVLVQQGDQIRGSITPTTCSVARNPERPNVPIVGHSEPIVQGSVSHARGVYFGVESALYTDLSDNYFHATLSEDFNTMSSGPCTGGCASMSAVRRQ
jgi:PKD domain